MRGSKAGMRAATYITTCLERVSHRSRSVRSGLEETQRLLAIADEQILGLLVVVEHHLVSLATDAGLFAAAECRMRRIGVVTIRPHAAGLDFPAEAIGTRTVASPYTGAETVQRI